MKLPTALVLLLACGSAMPLLAQSSVRPGTRAPRYLIRNIGTLSSDITLGVRGQSINNRGHVHGENTLPAPPGQGKIHGFLWDGHSQQHIMPLSPSVCFSGGMNDRDQCVGYSFAPNSNLHAYQWDAGLSTDVHCGSLNFSKATGINEIGNICGTNSRFVSGYIVSQFRPYIQDPLGAWIDLGTFGGGTGFAYALNDHDQVVGTARDATEATHGFIWEHVTGMVDLGTLGGAFATPYGINNFGQVVGTSSNQAGEFLPFLWEAGVMGSLSTLGGTEGNAKGINDYGAMVGNSTDAAGVQHATLWATGSTTPVDLGTLIRPGTAWDLTGASSINELGEICGTGTLAGNQRAFRLTPILRRSRLSGAQPGMAGRTNTVFGLGFEPGAVVSLAYGIGLGSTPAPGCSSAFFGIGNAQVTVNAVADADGRIEVTVDLPSGLAGTVLYSQALETANCRLSEVRSQLIQ